ncbi:hypothetical protein ACFLSE_09145 [Bacteroidota bacterium]
MKMKYLLPTIILTSIVIIFFNSCDEEEDNLSYNLVGDWKVISFEDYDASTKITKTEENTWSQFNNGDITVNFSNEESTKGIISGINVTNTFHGNYKTNFNGEISIDSVLWTMINEPDWGRLFHSIIDADTYEIRNGYLILFYNQKKNSITLEKN